MDPKSTWFGTGFGVAIAALCIGALASPALAGDRPSNYVLIEKDGVRAEAAPESQPVALPDSPDFTAPEHVRPPRAPHAAGNVVRMVTDDEDGDPITRLCVFVPSGDGDAGVLSCSGKDDVRVLEFGPEHGRSVMFGDDVIHEEELREMIEERMEAVADRLEHVDDMRIEYLGRVEETEEYREEMTELREEMRELERDQRERERELRLEALSERIHIRERYGDHDSDTDHGSVHDREWEFEFSAEEQEEFQREMAEFEREMEEFGQEMASMQAEVMIELSESLGSVFGEDFGEDFGEGMAELGAGMAEIGVELARALAENEQLRRISDHTAMDGRTTIRIVSDENFTIVETIESDDGEIRLVIHTTDPSSIEIIPAQMGDMDMEHEH